jgi:hypothetical protein
MAGPEPSAGGRLVAVGGRVTVGVRDAGDADPLAGGMDEGVLVGSPGVVVGAGVGMAVAVGAGLGTGEGLAVGVAMGVGCHVGVPPWWAVAGLAAAKARATRATRTPSVQVIRAMRAITRLLLQDRPG